MAGLLPSFASGATLAIRIGNTNVAYATNLSFVDDVTQAPVGGIGSYSFDALEPTQYIARGNFSLMRYSALAHKANTGLGASVPSRATSETFDEVDGNSMLHPSQFNPVRLLVSRTFDIKIYERVATPETLELVLSEKPVFHLHNCRFTNYAIAFTPGSLVGENIGFMCILAEDRVARDSTVNQEGQ